MQTPVFAIAPEIFERFPDYIAGWVIAEIPSNRGPNPGVNNALHEAEERALLLYKDVDLKTIPAFSVWRKAFSQAGWSASRFPASVEALVKRATRGTKVTSINPAVDLGLAATLTYLVPVGCHDRDRSPELTVRVSRHGDTYLPLGDGELESPEPGEVVYASGSNIRTRRWVWRQSRDGVVTPRSTRILMPVDGFESVTLTQVQAATNYLDQMLNQHLRARTWSGIATREEPVATITANESAPN